MLTDMFKSYCELYVQRGWPLPRFARDAMYDVKLAGHWGSPAMRVRSSKSTPRSSFMLGRVASGASVYGDWRGDTVTRVTYCVGGGIYRRVVAEDGSVTEERYPAAGSAPVAPAQPVDCGGDPIYPQKFRCLQVPSDAPAVPVDAGGEPIIPFELWFA